MSEYYEANARNPQACSFAGNGTVNSAAPSSVTAANAAASSCLSNPSATFVPTAGGGTATAGPTGTAGGKSGAPSLMGDRNGLLAVGMMMVICAVTGVWTLV
jgi:hypothetical protein